MITKIGVVAGDIWNHLEKNDFEDSLKNIVNALDKDRNLVLMSLGWLAREGHIILEGDKTNYHIKLITKVN